MLGCHEAILEEILQDPLHLVHILLLVQAPLKHRLDDVARVQPLEVVLGQQGKQARSYSGQSPCKYEQGRGGNQPSSRTHRP